MYPRTTFASGRATPRLEPLEDRTLMSTCRVVRLTDQGVGDGLRGDLRYCISFANSHSGADVIEFAVTGTVNLQTPLPSLSGPLQIIGPGADVLTVSRGTGTDFRILTVYSYEVYISRLTLANGAISSTHSFDAYGGGIYNTGTLVLDSCTISGNSVTNYFAGRDVYGGGIYNKGKLRIVNSTILNNKALSHFGIEGTKTYGGGIYNTGTLNLVNSTVSNNASASDWDYAAGGGIFNATAATLTISHSTIAKNSLDFGAGGGIFTSGILRMRNTILAGNISFFGYPDLYGSLTTSGFNLVGNSTGGSGYAPSDILDVDPKLDPLGTNGGPTLTMALLPGSPAIDAGINTDAPEWDQRGPGFPRLVNGTVDIGAFEVQSTGTPRFSRLTYPSPVTLFSAILATADLDSLD